MGSRGATSIAEGTCDIVFNWMDLNLDEKERRGMMGTTYEAHDTQLMHASIRLAIGTGVFGYGSSKRGSDCVNISRGVCIAELVWPEMYIFIYIPTKSGVAGMLTT